MNRDMGVREKSKTQEPHFKYKGNVGKKVFLLIIVFFTWS